MRSSEAAHPGSPSPAVLSRRIHLLVALLIGAGAVLVIAVSEAGGQGWGWTGFPDNGHLWDWLNLLILPLVLLLLPLWVVTQGHRRAEWTAAAAVLAAGFAVVVYGGYELGWEWTGFEGNHLWDWLEMLVLPFTVALLPFWLTARRRLTRRHTAAAAGVLALFAALVACGYAVPWDWTGFEGNTLWDWIQLFLVPFAIPVAVAVLSVTARLVVEEERPPRDAVSGSGVEV
jgi:heme/copper-type cytochrome/quinol oxidase subunit 4